MNFLFSLLHYLTARLVTICRQKCLPKEHLAADLSKADSVCSDRCVDKYFQVLEKTSAKLTSIGQNAGK